VTPLGDKLLLRLPPAPERVGRIWIPQTAQRDYALCQAVVLARGPAVRDSRLQPGARVVVKRFGKVTLDARGEEFMATEAQLLAILAV